MLLTLRIRDGGAATLRLIFGSKSPSCSQESLDGFKAYPLDLNEKNSGSLCDAIAFAMPFLRIITLHLLLVLFKLLCQEEGLVITASIPYPSLRAQTMT